MTKPIKGKICWFDRKDIKKIDKDFDLINFNDVELYDLLEEAMLEMGFVFFDNDFEFDKEIICNGWHELRYSCMVLKGKRRKGRFILHEVGIQYYYIK